MTGTATATARQSMPVMMHLESIRGKGKRPHPDDEITIRFSDKVFGERTVTLTRGLWPELTIRKDQVYFRLMPLHVRDERIKAFQKRLLARNKC